MASVSQLGYLGIGVKSVDEWTSYAEGLLGIAPAGRDGDGTTFLRMDDHHHRFALHEDGSDDIAYVGLQVDGGAELDEVSGRLSNAGVAVRVGTREEAERRRVAGLVKLQDPNGVALELFHTPDAGLVFHSPKDGAAFVTGKMGMGHAVFFVDDLDATMAFYTTLLGFRISDYVTMGRTRLGFLHCNPRHHSLAFLHAPGGRKRAHHFMMQLQDINTMGRTYDVVEAGAAPLLTTLGQHSNDQMVSFYMRNPSGFGVEYGWGGLEIDDACWQVQTLEGGSTWGHKPAPR